MSIKIMPVICLTIVSFKKKKKKKHEGNLLQCINQNSKKTKTYLLYYVLNEIEISKIVKTCSNLFFVCFKK